MKPIEFPEQNCVYAKDQPEYLPLPVHRTKDGMVISCWALTWGERLRVLVTGMVWWSVSTFNSPLQPQLPQVRAPFRRTTRTRLAAWWADAAERLTQIVGPRFVREGEIVPGWMGVAYRDFACGRLVVWAVPLHHCASLAWRINAAWCRYRGKPSWVDAVVAKALLRVGRN